MAANSGGVCPTWKRDVMKALHNHDTHQFKLACYPPNQSISPALEFYTSTGEVAATGTYQQGGQVQGNGSASVIGTAGCWTPTSDFSVTGVTMTTDCAMLYNFSSANRAVQVFAFQSQTVTAGNFGLKMPVNDASNALCRIL